MSTIGVLVGAGIMTATVASAAMVVDHIPESLAAPEANAGATLPWYSLLNWLYLLSGVKLAVTFFKYMPQVWWRMMVMVIADVLHVRILFICL